MRKVFILRVGIFSLVIAALTLVAAILVLRRAISAATELATVDDPVALVLLDDAISGLGLGIGLFVLGILVAAVGTTMVVLSRIHRKGATANR